MDLVTEARYYVDAFEAEFGSLPDLSNPSDSEHASTSLEAPELRGACWEAWSDAVRDEVSRRVRRT